VGRARGRRARRRRDGGRAEGRRLTSLLFREVELPAGEPLAGAGPGERRDVRVEGARIESVAPSGTLPAGGAQVVEGRGLWLLPGFIDDHVHLREPGLEHKEGYASGTRAAAAGGITTLFEIQNNPPLLVSRAAVQAKLDLVRPKSAVSVGLYGSLVEEALPEVPAMADLVSGYKLFMGPSTGGLDVRGEERLARLFAAVARTGHWLMVHAEDGDLIEQGLLRHAAQGAAAFHLARPAAAEVRAVEQALALARREGTRLHVFHVSTAGATDLIAEARAAGQAVSAGTCPHYLWFTHEDTARLGTLLKVNPSIKGSDDRERLLAGLRDGTLDCLSSDHAPHTAEEKALDFPRAPSGIPSLDIFMPLCLTLARRGLLTLEQVVERAARAPARVHGLSRKGAIAAGHDADLVLLDPAETRAVRGAEHFSRARRTPYEGLELWGWPKLTVVLGRIVFRR
jgi:dihydroorotase